MTRRLKILHVVHKLDYGGLQRLVAALVQLLPPDQFESHILTLSDFGRFAEGLAAHAQLHQDRSLPHLSMIWPRRLTRTIRALAPDVVHTHSGVWFKASLAARRAGVPRLVHTDHGRPYPDSLPGRLLDGLAARRADVVVAVSDALRLQMTETLIPRPSRIRVVVNGIDTDLFRPQSVNGSLRGELRLPAGAPIIGSIGRLDPIKAYDVMLQAFARLRADWSDAQGAPPALVLVGDGPERARLSAVIEREGLRDAARLVGWRKDVERLYPVFDVFTLSSWSEGTSLGLLEAMSSGVCPVVTAVGGSPAALGERLRHRLVPAGDPAALAAAWRNALTDDRRRVEDAAVARQRVKQAFAIDAMVRHYARIYRGAA